MGPTSNGKRRRNLDRSHLEQGARGLGDPLDDSEGQRARPEHPVEEEGEQGVDHLAGQIGEQAGRPEHEDRAGKTAGGRGRRRIAGHGAMVPAARWEGRGIPDRL